MSHSPPSLPPFPTPHSPLPSLRLGIDLGGTKIAGVALGPDGATVAEHRMPSPRYDYAGTIEAIAAAYGTVVLDDAEHDESQEID